MLSRYRRHSFQLTLTLVGPKVWSCDIRWTLLCWCCHHARHIRFNWSRSTLRRSCACWYWRWRHFQLEPYLLLRNCSSRHPRQTCRPIRDVLADRRPGRLLDQLRTLREHGTLSRTMAHPFRHPTRPSWPLDDRRLLHQRVTKMAVLPRKTRAGYQEFVLAPAVRC